MGVASSSYLRTFWHGKRVFVTGHTGFKGCWLLAWLKMLGADVFGYSLEPSEPSMYKSIFENGETNGVFADIRDLKKLTEEIVRFDPEIVFHLAAQPIVRKSYREPVLTYETNIMGTVNLLDAIRSVKNLKSVVVITSDKCYKDKNWEWGYRETDELGGADPYSSSKACVELVCDSWRTSFLGGGHTFLATARAGNVIGGGDWAEDRLAPDAIRAFQCGESLKIRMPNAVRPWQHVLEPLAGYMTLASKLFEEGAAFAGAFNFGPGLGNYVSVEKIVQNLCSLWGGDARYEICEDANFHEARLLRLDPNRAMHRLGWMSRLNFDETLCLTAEWYSRTFKGEKPLNLVHEQIEKYMDRLGG